ncbi:MAG: prephenate dehydrogenase/arogenate dehydrogenase family protein [Aquificaceae bacterium]|nr:prephenate dehydrogenase/arogenate dehydrogenase family protein [Aquificaceae bacterium]MCS7278175.1 prephenate dehydrogenase/arogenate dehydrogenase family protein [Aquificaceae bacterium]MDW8424137.1 prephenate dehydrogenase/arogenate dehydrogenase family protein [Aquificaceae bacterium]
MFERVAVIGVGFMGGSFALACKEAINCQVFGVDINPEAIKKGKDLGVIDEGSTNLENIREFDPQLLVLATPVRTFIPISQSLRHVLSPDCIVSDLGSVKGKLVYRMEEILGERFVGGHPIAGTEKAGVENAIKDLFKDKRFIITPTQRTDLLAKEKVSSLWKGLGSLVEEMDPYLHDFVFGAVSHLPHAIAFALIDTIQKLSKEIDLFRYSGAGFRDFTRIAASDPIMWRDIFLENTQEVIKGIDAFIESLLLLKNLIEKGDEKALQEYLAFASNKRKNINQ